MLPIIACTDGSLHATAIYQNAAWAATRMNAAIRVLHVIERAEMVRCPSIAGTAIPLPNADLFEDLGRMDESHAHIARLRGEEVLATAEKILDEIEHCEVTTLQRHGTLHEVLQELEKDASLIVLGKRGEEADPTCRQLGGNLGHVVRNVHIPVWVAARDFRPIRRFLIAFDGGASSLKAVRHVATQALLRGLDCHLVAVGQPPCHPARSRRRETPPRGIPGHERPFFRRSSHDHRSGSAQPAGGFAGHRCLWPLANAPTDPWQHHHRIDPELPALPAAVPLKLRAETVF